MEDIDKVSLVLLNLDILFVFVKFFNLVLMLYLGFNFVVVNLLFKCFCLYLKVVSCGLFVSVCCIVFDNEIELIVKLFVNILLVVIKNDNRSNCFIFF